MKLAVTIVALVAALAPIHAEARDYRGMQAVLLMAWDDSSVSQLISTVANASNSLPSRRFELALLYIDEALPIHDDGSRRDRWDNVRRVIECLATVPQPAGAHCPVHLSQPVDLKVRVFFTFKGFAGATESADLAILAARARDFNAHMLVPYGNRIVFRLSPILEERSSINFPKYAATLFGQLSGERICGPIYPRLLRSGPSSPSTVTVSVRCSPGDVRLTSKTIAVQHESHGSAPESGYEAWSNDGLVAYEPPTETGDLALSKFIQTARSYDGHSLLWRPRYNLILYMVGVKNECVAAPPSSNVQRGYCVGNRSSIQERINKTKGAVFGSFEAGILRNYLTKEK